MAEHHTYNLEEQLRQDRRLGMARRRRRRLKWMIPLLALLLLGLVLWLVLRQPPEEPTPSTEAPVAAASAKLVFLGDISLDEAMLQAFRSGSDYDFSPLLKRVTPQLSTADLTIANLEGNITGPEGLSDHNYPSALLRDLYAAGIDILQTANSYTIQNGITGLARTREEILAAGMDPLGTWSSPEQRSENGVLFRDVNGLRFAFLAFTKGMNNLRLPDGADYCVNLLYTDYDTNYSRINRGGILSAIEEAKAGTPDVIVAMVHWGSEYDQQVADSQKEIAQLMLDNGVTLVVGSHSHYVSLMDLKSTQVSPLAGSFVAYSLGDFISVADTSTARNGCMLNVGFVRDRNGLRIESLSYTPTYSAAPSEALDIRSYEVYDTLDAIAFYQRKYYDRVSDALYDRMISAVNRMGEQTGRPDLMEKKENQ